MSMRQRGITSRRLKGGRLTPGASRSRSKKLFPTARQAWRDVARTTGLNPDDVNPAHTKATWRWVLK